MRVRVVGGGWVTYYESDNPNGFRTGQRFSVDAPALTVMADGLGGDSLGHWHLVGSESPPRPSAGPEKPAYRVPSMTEIAALPSNGLTVASTFSGCGGSCLGYRMAGYRVVWASEFVPIASESYRANAPDTILDTRDIRTVTADEILAASGLEVGALDLFDGSPPCQPFSTAGKRHKTWGTVREYGDHRQRADDLFFEYVRLVDGLKPRVFVAENVSGLVKGTAKGYFKEILRALKGCGYRVEARLCDAQWLGVPQARLRVIFVGVREDLDRAPSFPTPLPYRYSVRDALPWIGRVQVGRDDFRMSEHHPSPQWLATDGARSSSTLDCPIGLVELEGANGFNGHAGQSVDLPAWTIQAGRSLSVISEPSTGPLPSSRARAYDGQAVYGLTIVDSEKPSPTVTIGSPGNDIAPPVERRKFTIAELRRICAFPDDFVLCGSYAEQWARLGNAVPPVMMSHIAAVIRDQILLPTRS
jgi:DNA (cytosine-5)-methyltransferase 1